MSKTIEQLLQLSKNPYYVFTSEEQEQLNTFLAKKSELLSQQRKNGKDSEKNIPATVINKNIVRKDVGEIPVMENIVHPDAVN